MNYRRPQTRLVRIPRGFTLVELLVVIAIIGILVALLLPAVQAAREAARRAQCKNHLKQLSLGCLLHEDVRKSLPSGGWADWYTADANMGYGAHQPGSWYFNILPYIEEGALHDQNAGLNVNPEAPGARDATIRLNTTPVTIFHCPSRRVAKLYPIVNDAGDRTFKALDTYGVQSWIGNLPAIVKCDYAGNAGDSYLGAGSDFNGLKFVVPTAADYPALKNTAWTPTNVAPKGGLSPGTNSEYYQTGVIYYRSEIAGKRITDGTSNTYLIGEKFLSPSRYDAASHDKLGDGDNEGAYVGFEWDNLRRAWNPANVAPNNTLPLNKLPNGAIDENDFAPRQDADLGVATPNDFAFGSAHSGAMNMAMCDGSVQSISYDVDMFVHHYFAVRNDNQAPSLGQ